MSSLGARFAAAVSSVGFTLFAACSGESLMGPSEAGSVSIASGDFSIEIVTVTSGLPADPDGYTLTVDGEHMGAMGCHESRLIDGLVGSMHEVVLSDVAANCEVVDGNERVVSNQGSRGWVQFQVICSGAGRLEDQIVFTSVPRAFGEAIWVMDADGSNAALLSPPRQRSDFAAVSRDGSRIAFASTGEDFMGRWALYVMDADGSEVSRLTNFSDNIPGSWSPDGSRIAFTSGRHGGGGGKSMQAPGAGGGNTELYIIDANGSAETRLTDDPGQDLSPAWSPDGSSIAFATDREGNFEIYLMSLSDGKLQNLTANPALDAQPVWSPDGSRIAFTSGRDGNEEIYVMNPNGTDVRRLTDHPAADAQPAWSADGRNVLFTSDRGGAHQIYRVSLEGGAPEQLTDSRIESLRGVASP
jgi:TolB protein